MGDWIKSMNFIFCMIITTATTIEDNVIGVVTDHQSRCIRKATEKTLNIHESWIIEKLEVMLYLLCEPSLTPSIDEKEKSPQLAQLKV